MTASNRRALFDRIGGRSDPFRPPWALPEAQFAEACTSCGDCVTKCPERILVSGRGGLPQVDFSRGGCSFCGTCASVCREGAFRQGEGVEPWSLAAQIGELCVEKQGIACRLCEDGCDLGAIRFRPLRGGRSEARVDPDLCSGCGACVRSCPSNAIKVNLPENNCQFDSVEVRA